jgi:hypothetical protein
VFELANSFAKRAEVTVVLLHVVHLNIMAVENRVYEELGREAQWYLARLASTYLHPRVSALLHVRTGNPAEEILAEAKSANADLIILPTLGPSLWGRLTSLWRSASPPVSALGADIVREATCAVFVVGAKTRFNCVRAWGRPANSPEMTSGHLDMALESRLSPLFPTKESPVSASEPHRAVA